MKPKRILVPIDIARCPLEVFDRVNAFAAQPGVTVILLHVVTLSIAAPDNRVFEELGREAGWYLERLARKHVHPNASTLIHVRTGKAADEILSLPMYPGITADQQEQVAGELKRAVA